MAVYSDEKIEFFHKKKLSSPYTKMPRFHFHDKHEMYYLEEGKTKYFIGNEIYLLEAGDMIFVPKGAFHKTDSDECGGVERLLFVFDDDFAGEEMKEYIRELKKDKHIRFPREQLYKLKDIFLKIEGEDKKKQKDYYEMERLYLKQMLILISRYRLKEKCENLSQIYTIIQNAARYISENYSGDLSLKTVASRFAMSESYFSKQFKSVTGVGYNEYVNISRVSAAEKMLVKSNKAITEIAADCGFNDSNYFAAVFKKIKGITPKKYSSMNKKY